MKNFNRDNRNNKFNRRGSDSHQMHDAVCANCKGNCKVPFMPSSGKPVFCSNCFEKRGNGNNNSRKSSFSKGNFSPRDRKPQVNYNRQFEIINTKLDKIMKSLNLK